MTKAIAHTYTTVHTYRRQITLWLMAACLVCAVIYAANVYSVISHTVALQKIETQSASIESSVRSLDGKYLELSGNITPDLLRSHGFTSGSVSAYITRSASLGSVAISGHEL